MNTDLRSDLVAVPAGLPTFASAGLEGRAIEIGRIAADAHDYLSELLDARPEAQVLVLSEADWAVKSEVPLYGLPNAQDGTLTVAGTEAPFWSDLAAMAGEGGQAEMAVVYGGSDGVIRLGAFFDLVAVHEVAHLFHEGVFRFPRSWLQELFANLCLHAWVERRAPASLPTLLTLPQLGAQAPASSFEYRTREEFERIYSSMSGPNYVWYQFRLQLAAADLYGRVGESSVRRLFDAFRIDDRALAARLGEAVDAGLAAFSLAL